MGYAKAAWIALTLCALACLAFPCSASQTHDAGFRTECVRLQSAMPATEVQHRLIRSTPFSSTVNSVRRATHYSFFPATTTSMFQLVLH